MMILILKKVISEVKESNEVKYIKTFESFKKKLK